MILNQTTSAQSYTQASRANGFQFPAPPQQQGPVDGYAPTPQSKWGDLAAKGTAVFTTASLASYALNLGEGVTGLLGLPLLVTVPVALGSAGLAMARGGGLSAMTNKPWADKLGYVSAASGAATILASMAQAPELLVGALALPLAIAAPIATALIVAAALKKRKEGGQQTQQPPQFQPPQQFQPLSGQPQTFGVPTSNGQSGGAAFPVNPGGNTPPNAAPPNSGNPQWQWPATGPQNQPGQQETNQPPASPAPPPQPPTTNQSPAPPPNNGGWQGFNWPPQQ